MAADGEADEEGGRLRNIRPLECPETVPVVLLISNIVKSLTKTLGRGGLRSVMPTGCARYSG